jgi:predicted nucleotidyltransferase
VNIVLFGSRSRGDAGPDSDWDYLVCTKNEISFPEKATLASVVQTKLAEKHISADIIIRSEKQIANERGNVGVITYYALKDSVPV